MDESGQDPAKNPGETPPPEAESTPPPQFGTTPEPTPAPAPTPSQTGDVKGEFDSSDFVNSFIQTVKDVLIKPQEFFAAMPTNGGYGNVLLFGAVAAAIGALLGNMIGFNPGAAFAGIFLGPIGFVIGSFIMGGVIHVTSLIFADGAKGGFEGSWRAVAYPSGAVGLGSSIPFLGFFFIIYSIYLAIIGIQNVHSTTMGKAALAVLIPVALFLVIGTFIALIVGAAVFTFVAAQ